MQRLLQNGAKGTPSIVRSFQRSISPSLNRTLASSSVVERPTRAAQLARLENDEFDLVVVGGGCTGAGVALDAATRGLKVALVERDDFGAGTSSRSTKLLWAGSRYLVQALVKLFRPASLASPLASFRAFQQDFHMVLNCHKERAFLLREQPHLTQWLPIAVPMDRWLLWPNPPFDYPPAALGPLGLFALFFKVYDALGGWCAPPSHVMTKARTLRKFPQLNDHVRYCLVFYEGAHNDSRTALALALTAANHGAVVANHTEVVGFTRSSRSDPAMRDKVTGVVCRDLTDPAAAPFEVKGKAVVLCGGPFTDQLRAIEHDAAKPSNGLHGRNGNGGGTMPAPMVPMVPAVRGASGIHVVLPGYYAPAGMGMVDMATSDGRFLFFLPWLGHTLVGTTDSPDPLPSMRPHAPEQAIQWVLDEASKHLRIPVRRQDVLSAWSGTRPLASNPHAASSAEGGTAQASRDHVVSVDPASGLVFVAGGKWTTYREMAQDATDLVVHRLRGQSNASQWGPCMTLTLPLEGRAGWDPLLVVRLQQAVPGLPASQAQHLAATYGGRALEVLACTPKATTHANYGAQAAGRRDEGGTAVAAPAAAAAAEAEEDVPVRGTLLVAGFPYVEQEVAWAARHEYCATAAAVLGQRTRLAFLDTRAAAEALPRVVELLSAELGWSTARAAAELADGTAFLATFSGPVPQELTSLAAAAAAADASDPEAMAATAAAAADEEEEHVAIWDAFAALDVDRRGTLPLAELVRAARRMGLSDEKWPDARLQADLEAALPSLTAAASSGGGGGGGASGGLRGGGATPEEFAAWWRSSDASRCPAALKKRMHGKYAATPDKLSKATGVAFG